MKSRKVTENTHLLPVNLEGVLFEGIWEMPNGVSLNSYIVKGEKTAIIDGVGDWDGYPESLYSLLDELEIDPKSIEYIIINHMEPDHSGWIKSFQKINPDVKLVCGKKAAALLDAFFDIKENIIIVEDGQGLDLGNGHKLEFYDIPNIHWPETIATFDTKTGTLFSCDAFGSFGKLEDQYFDDELNKKQIDLFEEEAVRYYSNIIASYTAPVKKAIEKLKDLDIKIIAPGHGIVWRENPEKIVEDYGRYADYQKGPAKEEITIIWGSMYGMTEEAVKHIKAALDKEDIKVNIHRVPEDGWGDVLKSSWNSTGLVLAMPTYEYKMFPPMAAVLEELGKKKLHGRKVFRMGSYGWSGGAQKELDSIVDKYKTKWDFIEPVEFNGKARQDDLDLIEERAKELVEKVKEAVSSNK